MAVGDVYEARVEGVSGEGERWNIVLHFAVADQQSGTMYETSLALAKTLMAEWVANLKAFMTPSSTLTSVRANRIWPTIGIPASDGTGAGVGTSGGSESMPSDIAAVITKRTELPGRSGRGRVYVGNLVELDQINGALTETRAQALIDAFELTITSITPDIDQNEWGLVVFSPTKAAAMDPVPWTAVNRLEIDRVLRKQTNRGTRESIRLQPTP